MTLRLVLAVSACLMAAACGPRQGVIAEATTMIAAPSAEAGAPARYVGRWAASAERCGPEDWVLTSDSLHSPSGMNCDLIGPKATLAGYSASTLCTIGDQRRPTRLVMTFSGDDSLSLTNGPLSAPVSLDRCPSAPA